MHTGNRIVGALSRRYKKVIEQVISAGASAGGHLAFCTSIKNSVDDPNGDVSISSIPQTMVLYNLGLFYADSVQDHEVLGQLPDDKLHATSPLEHLEKIEQFYPFSV